MRRPFLALFGPLLVAVSASGFAGAQSARTLADYGYSDTTGSNRFSAASYFLPVPVYLAPQEGSEVLLDITYSTVAVADVSYVTAVVNGTTVASTRLSDGEDGKLQLPVPLPVEGFTGTGYAIEVLFGMRATDDQCEEFVNPALWATVSSDSAVNLVLEPSVHRPSLSDLQALLAPAGPNAEPVSIVLPAGANVANLDTSVKAAFAVGRAAARTGQDPAIVITDGPTDGPALLIEPRTDSDGDETGTLTMKRTATGPQLVIAGSDPVSLERAVGALATPEAPFFTGDTVRVGTADDAETVDLPWQEGAASFAQLGADLRQGTSPGLHSFSFEFDRPANWDLKKGSQLLLALETSPAIREDTSWVRISINGLDMGTQRLAPALDGTRALAFELPAELLNSDITSSAVRRLSLRIDAFLGVDTEPCEVVSPESFWLRLLPTSRWELPHREVESFDLARFPTGFDNDETVTIVLPAAPTNSEVEAAVWVAAAIGRWGMHEERPPALATADTLSEEAQGGNLVLIGNADRNQIAAEVGQEAPDLLVRPEVRLVRDGGIGWLRFGESPFEGDKGVLLLQADSDEALVAAATGLATREVMDAANGPVLVVQSGAGAGNAGDSDPPAALVPALEDEDSWLPDTWQVVAGVVLAGLVAVCVLFILTRLRSARTAA